MKSDRWQKIEKIFTEALTLPNDKRTSFIKQKSANDTELSEEILTLVSEIERDSTFLSDPVFSLGLELIEREKDTLVNQSTFGAYKLKKLLGYGGMGTVYLANDTRLGRLVALKILSPLSINDGEAIIRFQREARAASSISHPNVAHIYEFDFADGHYFLAMEYVKGSTLRQLLSKKELSAQQAVGIGMQISNALTAAHSCGIVHGDIKPENIILRDDKYVRVLDFGLAEFTKSHYAAAEMFTAELDLPSDKTPKPLIGTIAYMSPEQIKGEVIDERSDIWGLGVVLYEMLMHRRPFNEASKIETLNSIVEEEIQDNEKLEQSLHPLLARIVRRALSKDPKDRFQSATDLTFALETYGKVFQPTNEIYPLLSGSTEKLNIPVESTKSVGRKKYLWLAILIAGLLIGAVTAVWYFSEKRDNAELQKEIPLAQFPSYHQLTFQRGTIWAARFTPDGQSLIYSATWNGKPLDIFAERVSTRVAKSLNLANANLLDVSSKGEMAILLPKKYLYQFIQRGTLAEMPIEGSKPREIAEDVQEADWSPDGTKLAIVRWFDGQNRLEYPVGNVLFETNGYLSSPRVSPDGKTVAFLEHTKQWDNRGYVSIVDADKNKRTISGEWSGEEGLAWAPSGKEICFTASKSGESYALYSVSLDGKERLLARAPNNIVLYDISPEGRILLARANQSTDVFGRGADQPNERNLSWLQLVGLSDLSPDGSTFLLTHFGYGSGSNYEMYLRTTDGAPPIKIGEGRALALSPNKELVVAKLNDPEQLNIVPTKSGTVIQIPRGNIEKYERAGWFPNNQQILFTGNEYGQAKRTFLLDTSSGEYEAITPEGITGTRLSPDGKLFVASLPDGRKIIFSVADRKSYPIDGLKADEEIVGWGKDNKSLFVCRLLDLPLKVYRLSLDSKQRSLVKEINPSDKSGIMGPVYLFLASDEKSYIYGLRRYFFDLYLADDINLQ